MKKLNFKTVLIIVVTLSVTITTFGQQNHDHSKMNHKKGMMKGEVVQQKMGETQFNDANLNKAYMHYIMINKALVKSQPKKAQMMSKMLVDILNNYGKASESLIAANKLAESDNLENQRKTFAELTISMEPLFKDNITKGKVYKNFCPMANGSGAYWFSDSENIVNPYMGAESSMSSCGSAKETFKSI
ncbi:DUF3347 domain-containing protein [Lutibacter sp.]|uniref:DUF3347 domain-containing protein n=1 Tax=Lutibacter sp. TaxID=1925666 RepID=UPI0025B9AF01|nr:DUF3347 domain-containing protein [Lutibacter sp.]MCF6167188.1 DUF3347 domain-containing protein [Lutibacter sp.]